MKILNDKKGLIAIIAVLLVILGLSIFLFTRTKKTTTSVSNPTSNTASTETIELSAQDRPYISLTPRADGHLLTLKIDNLPSSVTQVDYELIYDVHDTASDQDIEKGVDDTIKDMSGNISRDLLLGTESCTAGCKYSYDNGVTGGTLTLTLTTVKGQATFTTPFVLKSSADIKKEGGLSLSSENVTIKATTTTKNDFFVMIKDYGLSQGVTATSAYSVFSNGTGAGKVSSISPETITKENTSTLTGDYLIK
jgi:hypothetical protein